MWTWEPFEEQLWSSCYHISCQTSLNGSDTCDRKGYTTRETVCLTEFLEKYKVVVYLNSESKETESRDDIREMLLLCLLPFLSSSLHLPFLFFPSFVVESMFIGRCCFCIAISPSLSSSCVSSLQREDVVLLFFVSRVRRLLKKYRIFRPIVKSQQSQSE